MKKLNCRILENKRITADIHRMRIRSPYLANAARPGQFFEVRCSDKPEPLLRRPLGLHRKTKNGVELLYEVVGRGTQALSKRRPGEILDVIGPLGNGFDIEESRVQGQGSRKIGEEIILVAGGVGVAPLVALAESVASRQFAVPGKRKVHVFIGAKTKKHILCEREFKRLGAKVHIATDDGSRGHKGFVTDLLISLLSTRHSLLNVIYACGPHPMLKAVAHIARLHKVPCQVSLEERMACGVGVCLGCPVKVRGQGPVARVKEEYKMVCKDGPVFNAEEVIW